MMKEFDYKTPYIGAKYRIVIFLVLGPVWFWVLKTILSEDIPLLLKGIYNQNMALGLIIIVFALSFLIVFSIPFALEWWGSSFYVDIDNKKITGYNLWKQPKEMQLSSIRQIKASKIYKWAWMLRANIVLIDEKGNKLRLHVNIEELRSLMNEVKKKGKAIESIDYGPLKDNERVWQSGPKQMT